MALRVGVLWQKLIRFSGPRQAGSARGLVCDTYATFLRRGPPQFRRDQRVGGRSTWKLEVDERLTRAFGVSRAPPPGVNSPEYIHKHLHAGAGGGAARDGGTGAGPAVRMVDVQKPAERGKRTGAGIPQADLTAIDFRAGRACCPCCR